MFRRTRNLSMMIGMTPSKIKVAVTLSPGLVERARARVAVGEYSSLSAFVEHAIGCQLAAEADFDSIIDEMLDATGGPPSAAERAEARRLLDGSAA